MKHKNRNTLNRWAVYGLKAFAQLIRILPYSIVCVIFYPFLEIAYFFLKGQRKTVRKSLEAIYKNNKSSAEIETIIKKCFKNLGMEMINILSFFYHPHRVSNNIVLSGMDGLNKTLQNSSKGLIIATAHLSNFPLMFMKLVQEGYKVNVIIRPMRNQSFGAFIDQLSRQWGVNLIPTSPRKEFIQRVWNAIDQKELMFVLVDEPSDAQSGLHARMLGKEFHMSIGALRLASIKNTAIYSMFITEGPAHHYQVNAESLLTDEQTQEAQKNSCLYIDRITSILEKHILQYPEQWGGWFNRRWQKLK
jgi:KDO2-lipid IV(A) lauroyltransferase